MRVLGIETSCDETAAAIVDDDRRILANRVLSQDERHRPFGGVVPEIAARAHLDALDDIVAGALGDAGLTLAEVDGIAATAGPGLIGGVIVGCTFAKALALAANKPFLGVNHLEGHALTVRLTDGIAFPYLLLLVSGGHCQLLAVEGLGRYRRLGGTIDDAAGEAFDKVAKLLNLGFPGGPAVERAALAGNPSRFTLPRPLLGRPGCDFSFSGLKTAVRLLAEAEPEAVADIAAGFQAAVGDVLADRTRNALAIVAQDWKGQHPLVVAGGVAANQALRHRLLSVAAEAGVPLVVPPPRLCTDNGAMIAWAGLERLAAGQRDSLSLAPRPRWPLEDLTECSPN
ncbi:MAG: tRNA (adenosine(37)-N6)-threonylcarbamoyltransferase complex transferase subunit TsaD [Alphaproteobacteria bacterium]|nr:MAG: tRNA (adenosine(37)-N6)-threonylcarbamoyltransferase complex transferase subunit TsaD [Alphaproteobacteria bacterium]